MKLKRFASALTVSVLLLSVCGCQDNSNTYTEILSEEELATRYSTTTTTTSEESNISIYNYSTRSIKK